MGHAGGLAVGGSIGSSNVDITSDDVQKGVVFFLASFFIRMPSSLSPAQEVRTDLDASLGGFFVFPYN